MERIALVFATCAEKWPLACVLMNLTDHGVYTIEITLVNLLEVKPCTQYSESKHFNKI